MPQIQRFLGADAVNGLILLQTHLSHTSTGLAALPRGGFGGQLCIPSAVVPCWPTCGSAAVSAASAHGSALSGEIITPSSQPIKHTVTLPACARVCVRVCVYQSRHWPQQQFLSTNEHQLNENRKAMHSLNAAFLSLSATLIQRSHTRVIRLC